MSGVSPREQAEEYTDRELANEMALIGQERTHQMQNIRRAGRGTEADLANLRLPKLRAAYRRFDQLAKAKGE